MPHQPIESIRKQRIATLCRDTMRQELKDRALRTKKDTHWVADVPNRYRITGQTQVWVMTVMMEWIQRQPDSATIIFDVYCETL